MGSEFILRLPWLLKPFSVVRFYKGSTWESPHTGNVEESLLLRAGTCSYHLPVGDLPDVHRRGLLGTRLSGHTGCVLLIIHPNKQLGVSLKGALLVFGVRVVVRALVDFSKDARVHLASFLARSGCVYEVISTPSFSSCLFPSFQISPLVAVGLQGCGPFGPGGDFICYPQGSLFEPINLALRRCSGGWTQTGTRSGEWSMHLSLSFANHS